MSTQTQSTEQYDQQQASNSRKKGFTRLGLAIILAAIGYCVYWYFVSSHYISTENAYVNASSAIVTPAVSGIVTQADIYDTQQVKKGDVLVRLDDTDARIAVQQAEADLALAKIRVQSYMANDEGFTALVNARIADENRVAAELASATASFERAKIDLTRRENLVESGSVSGQEVTDARSVFAQAQANLNAAKAAAAQAKANRLSTIGQKKANKAKILHTGVDDNPEVLAAEAALEQAKVNLARTVIHAPISGVIAKSDIEVGRRIQAGANLMTIVPLDKIYVNANFKEVELTDVKVGQPVTLTADLYGDDIVYHGVVAGISPGTGSAFSIIPAQNATGNWIKVVQRLPVRVELAPSELESHPLQVGLSMKATIDTDADIDTQKIAQYRQQSQQPSRKG
ncbi:HlyD family efflux transporter periplasmic adaptor subunit [Alteromonas sp. C1M14]|uniref:HlyD family secretion protein n=1 Tax=Alteromonas sp. C1M14 TaxID=2841567 RepID=UPI001C08BE0C|nr:HlyD family efflux transporter periplasmic adaptor subunit [Alteromonas sp. C1M14]MBU2979574.1 HlyD family efflux transporter periplasmic adaptor subunit [Alteromonas sp. C1M14]